jgi:antirestriction protein ArdC
MTNNRPNNAARIGTHEATRSDSDTDGDPRSARRSRAQKRPDGPCLRSRHVRGSNRSMTTHTWTSRSRRTRDAGSSGGKTPASERAADSGGASYRDVYALVTERITQALEAGAIPWHRPWTATGGLPRNLSTKRAYRGMNLLLLSVGQPYVSPWWLTFRQAHELGGHIRKGEHASIVTFWKRTDAEPMPCEEADAQASETRTDRRPPILRYYNVFNVEQCEGIDTPPSDEFQPKEHERIARCEEIVQAMPQRPSMRHDPKHALYSPQADTVGIPDIAQFNTAQDYYATLFHELVHSTGHAQRLARPALGCPLPFGTPDYSREELVAELGAAFLCAHAGIFPATVDNQAAYIGSWLAALRSDKRMLPVAAAQAQRAADYILDVRHDPAASSTEQ